MYTFFFFSKIKWPPHPGVSAAFTAVAAGVPSVHVIDMQRGEVLRPPTAGRGDFKGGEVIRLSRRWQITRVL